MHYAQIKKANQEKKYHMAKAQILLQQKCQESIAESFEKMQLNERVYFMQQNQKFFEFKDEPNQLVGTLNLKAISLQNQMKLALDLTKYIDKYN